MKIHVVLKGGASSIEGEVDVKDLDELYEILKLIEFLPLEKSYNGGTVMVSKSAIAYFRKAQ